MKKGVKKISKDDDDFYSQMAAGVNSDSDISDADPVEMSRKLANLDVLDADLFSPRDRKSNEAKPKPFVSTKTSSKDLDDLDDDLVGAIDDILGDDFGDSPKKKKEEKKSLPPALASTAPAVTPKVAAAPKVEVKKEKSAVSFSSDEDDLLPDQNLSKTAPAATTPSPVAKKPPPRRGSAGLLDDDDDDGARPARSALSSLLGKPKAVEELEKPKEKKEFTLDSKYTSGASKKSQAKKEEEEDDFWGASYRPSTSRPSRRSVHFEDETEFGLSDASKRPVTAPSKGAGPADWLGLGDDLDLSPPPSRARQTDPLSQTAPLPSTKSDSGVDKFVSRFEMTDSPPKTAPPKAAPVNSYLDLGEEVDLNAIIAAKKKPTASAPVFPDLSASTRVDETPKSTAKELASSPPRQELDFDLDLEPTTAKTRTGRRRRSSSGSKSASPDRVQAGTGRTATEKPPSGRKLAEMFKSEREDSMQAVYQQAQQQQQDMFLKQQEAMQARALFAPAPMIGGGDMKAVMELENKIKKLEMEKEHLNVMMDMLRRRHSDELQMMEESHKSKAQILEETFQRREQRIREENTLLSEQSLEKAKAVERERSDMRSELARRTEEAEREKGREIARLRDQHREEMDSLRREHAQAIESLRLARQQEYEAMKEAQPTARSIQTVLDQLSTSAKDLSSLQTKVDSGHSANREEKEGFLKARDEQLRTLEERLRRQEEDTQRERERLQDIVSKMDVQLREQTRLMEEEKWKTKQETNRLAAQQTAVEEERRLLMEQIRRERESVERAKSSVLSEQKQLLAQLFDERKVLAEERLQFNLQQSEWMEKQQKSSVRTVQSEADLESQFRVTQEEKRRVSALEAELRESREAVRRDKVAFERERAVVEGERARIEAMEAEIRRRERMLEEREDECERQRRSSESALFAAKQTEEEQSQRLSNIASQQAQLRAKEKQLTQERLMIARQREDMEKRKDSILCVNCQVPVRDSAAITSPSVLRGSMTSPLFPSRLNLAEEEDPMAMRAIRRSQEVAQAMEADRAIRMMQMEAEKDDEFLQEEKAFLNSLRKASFQNGM